ncbi:MAG: hypothetical protein NVV82_13100 [Sporocytophaga sp.]|nr:hypothetical protein [Sporocytophaga sp.]
MKNTGALSCLITMKSAVLILTFALWACHYKKYDNSFNDGLRCEDCRDDSTEYTFTSVKYREICKKLFIRSYTPDEKDLLGEPDSYSEWVSDYTNWTKEESEKVWKESKGTFYLDSTDRDFEKFWYNKYGMLTRYEISRFGDMIHSECLFIYNQDKSIAELRINDILADDLRFKNRTVIINADGEVLDIRNNIISVGK